MKSLKQIARNASELCTNGDTGIGLLKTSDLESIIMSSLEESLREAEHRARLVFASSSSNDFVLGEKMLQAIGKDWKSEP